MLQQWKDLLLQVLDVLDRQPEGDLLLNLRAHLASVGVTRIADVLRWEALVHLLLQDTAAGTPGTDMLATPTGACMFCASY